jgi:uncharacterized membrane protein
MTENKLAIYKSFSWHIVHTVILVITVFLFTGKLDIVAGIVSVHVLSETVIYYLHERVWQKKNKKKR